MTVTCIYKMCRTSISLPFFFLHSTWDSADQRQIRFPKWSTSWRWAWLKSSAFTFTATGFPKNTPSNMKQCMALWLKTLCSMNFLIKLSRWSNCWSSTFIHSKIIIKVKLNYLCHIYFSPSPSPDFTFTFSQLLSCPMYS